MKSIALRRAIEYEAEHMSSVDKERPRFHVTGGVGWMNDPNGFAPYKGEYHLFYQYNPYDTKWGPMHWGHLKTKDFIKWERLPVALAPDTDYDKDGVFSGGAVEMPDGRQLLMYTGERKARRADGASETFETQCIAIGDGVNYEKYAANPVITAGDLPEGSDIHDFRDPHIWLEGGVYYAVVANRSADGSGAILLYQSTDALRWEFVSRLAACRNRYGKMWECPDFFFLDGKAVLLTSPQEMQPGSPEFHPGNGNICILGSFSKDTHRLSEETVQAVDCGLDFYAMQTLQSYDGRRIMIAWMQNWQTCSCRPENLHFMGQMTLPRELRIRDGRLYQLPVRELEQYRSNKTVYENVLLTGEASLPGVSGRFADITVSVRPGSGAALYSWFNIKVAAGGAFFTSIRFEPASNTLRVDRTNSGLPGDIINVRDFPVMSKNGELKLRIILDRYSVEIFVNDGAQAASNVIYTPLEAESIRFSCEGTVLLDVEKYDLALDC